MPAAFLLRAWLKWMLTKMAPDSAFAILALLGREINESLERVSFVLIPCDLKKTSTLRTTSRARCFSKVNPKVPPRSWPP